MPRTEVQARIVGKVRVALASGLCRVPVLFTTGKPTISFTFDDVPKSAIDLGGKILGSLGFKATYFISLGTLGLPSPSGELANRDDLIRAIENGHELGCHTYNHLDAATTPWKKFIRSIDENRTELQKTFGIDRFRTFAYPKSIPRLSTKCRVRRLFECCRGGGQTNNERVVDRALLKSYFLDRRKNPEYEELQRLIDKNNEHGGWLIFATHDVAADPSIYGCNSGLFEKVAKYVERSGALVMPVSAADEELFRSREPVAK